YAIQSAIGKSVVQLLEQMQRSGVVDPLFAQLGGHTAISEDGQSHDQPGVTVITTPAAHKVIGAFIDGLRELRPAPGQKGPAELEIRRVIYDWDASWDISRGLAGLLEEAVKMGHIGYVRIGSNKDDRGLIVTTDRMSITTTDPVHNVIGTFIEFLNEQQALQGAAAERAPAAPPPEPASDPSAYGSARALGGGPVAGEPQQDDGGRGRRSRLPSKPSPIAGEPQQVESRGGFGASRLGSGTSSTPAAASAKRPQVVTDAE